MSSSSPAADAMKAEGNAHFKANEFVKAIESYTKAIELDGTNAVYYANRAQCHIKMEDLGLAVMDATKAIEADPSYVKGYFRRGTAYFGQGKYKDAFNDFKAVVKVAPQDRLARSKFNICKKQVRLAAFAAAIESENSKPMSEQISIDDYKISDTYDGPRIDIDSGGGITVEFMTTLLDYFREQKSLPKKYVVWILLEIIKQLSKLPSLVRVDVPESTHITVCGDVHGQYYDLLNIFNLYGIPSETNPFLFNGDFVDRGSFSVEIILTLFAFKLLYPNQFHLTRGNHEALTMNQIYGFQGEVNAKYDSKIFQLFSEAFCWLPLCFVLQGASNNKVMVMHGGLFSRDGVTLKEIEKIDRFRQPPDSGLMCELLWSDPQEQIGRAPSKRGVGLSFGPDVTERFCNENGLDLIVRSHEVKQEGYEVQHNGKCITIFSAPNYVDQMDNKGAVIRFESDLKPTFRQFDAVPHPNVKPMQYANPMFARG